MIMSDWIQLNAPLSGYRFIPYDQHFTHASLPLPKARDVGIYMSEQSNGPLSIRDLPPILLFQVSPGTIVPCIAKCCV